MELSNNSILTVTEFLNYINGVFRNIKFKFFIKGEISSYTDKGYSGASYFSIKDETSTLNVVMFANYKRNLTFVPKNGYEVVISGSPNIFQAAGRFNFIAESMKKSGIGDIMEKLRQQKEKWKNTYFAKTKRLPNRVVKNIFVVTSLEGAVIRDIIRTRNIRDKRVNIYILPALMQGKECEYNVSNMVYKANQIVEELSQSEKNDVNFDNSVLIVARGGGSFEDLLPFYGEKIVKSFFESKLIVVSSIGHETDEPFCDYASDIRASTPTQAVELVVEKLSNLRENLNKNIVLLSNYFKKIVQHKNDKFNLLNSEFNHSRMNFLSDLKHNLEMKSYNFSLCKQNFLQNKIFNQDRLMDLFDISKKNFIQSQIKKINIDVLKFQNAMTNCKNKFINEFEKLERSLNLLSPYNILSRGYSIITDENNSIIDENKILLDNKNYNIYFNENTVANVKISEVKYAKKRKNL